MIRKPIVGRQSAIATLEEAYASETPTLVSIVGRRRIGKTFLVRQVYRDRISFAVTGILNAPLREQLGNFRLALLRYFGDEAVAKSPTTWLDAFALLGKLLERHLKQDGAKRVVFLDEVPWLASHRSGFLRAFGWFWNSWAVEHRVVVVICGSAASWMVRKVIRDRGGLHNRITHRIRLDPFTLAETSAFMDARQLVGETYQRVQLYMALGGVPFYLEQLRSGETAIQAVQRLFFDKAAPLAGEFEILFRSLFAESEYHTAIVRALADKQVGYTREDLRKAARINSSGTLTRVLEELQLSGFILRSQPFGKTRKDALYRLMDEYSRFYLKFVEGAPTNGAQFTDIARTPSFRTWSGLAFENLAIRHARQLTHALNLDNVAVVASTFIARGTEDAAGVQVDLLFDRSDRAITLVEVKFSDAPFTFTQAHANELRSKRARFVAHTGTRKAVFIALLTTFGVESERYSLGVVDQVVEVEELMQ